MSSHNRFYDVKCPLTPGARGILGAEESRHARQVLRLRTGDRARVFDGRGCEVLVELEAPKEGRVRYAVLKPLHTKTEGVVRPTLCLALSKGNKLDLVVQKATELGVQRLMPFSCARGVPRVEAGAPTKKRLARWNRVALAAAKQCGRAQLPAIDDIADFDRMLTAAADCAPRLMCYEEAEPTDAPLLGQALREWDAASQATPAMLIGPEGGFTAAEAATAVAAGWRVVSLGRRILRCETAAIAALSLLLSAADEM